MYKCTFYKSSTYTPRIGDLRVNDQVGLAALHTIFMREHNRVEEVLHGLNPHWSGEKLYQESRRIIGAMFQVIVYREYLPLIIGPQYMHYYRLELLPDGYFDGEYI